MRQKDKSETNKIYRLVKEGELKGKIEKKLT